jgi:hypothetical protein
LSIFDNRFSFDVGRAQCQLAIEHDDVGPRAARETAAVFDAKVIGGVP